MAKQDLSTVITQDAARLNQFKENLVKIARYNTT